MTRHTLMADDRVRRYVAAGLLMSGRQLLDRQTRLRAAAPKPSSARARPPAGTTTQRPGAALRRSA